MAIIGVKGLVKGELNEETGAYSNIKTIADTIDIDIKINNNDAKLYADDHLVESDMTFKDGDVALQVSDLEDEIKADMLGHEYKDGETIYNSKDTSPYEGIGFYATRMVHNVRMYRAVVFLKTKFSEPSEKYTTKGDSISFQTPTINGKISTLSNGDWKRDKTFKSEEEAIEYINNVLGANNDSSEGEENTDVVDTPDDGTETE